MKPGGEDYSNTPSQPSGQQLPAGSGRPRPSMATLRLRVRHVLRAITSKSLSLSVLTPTITPGKTRRAECWQFSQAATGSRVC